MERKVSLTLDKLAGGGGGGGERVCFGGGECM